MMTLLLFAGLALFVLFSIAAVAHLGKEWLYGAIIANLFFVSIFGAKLVEINSFVSNIGNVFYAGVFFATYLLIEHYGAEAARQAIWLGGYVIVLFMMFSLVVVALPGVPSNVSIDLSLGALYSVVPRIAIASIFAYLMAQHINIWLYSRSRSTYPLWGRALLALVVAQAIDSVLFSYVAFSGVLPPELLWEALWAGYVVKVAVGVASIPLLMACVRLRGVDVMATYFPERKSMHAEGPHSLGRGPLG